jgi:tRNA (guanine37-N1)-methyltransferase
MKVSIISLYTDAIQAFVKRGVIGRALERQVMSLDLVSLRDSADLPHRKVDAYPFSNRKGMLLRYDVLKRAMQPMADATFVMPDPTGPTFNHCHAKALSRESHICFVSPAYEGVDTRIFQAFPIQRYSLGDFILTNGDTPIMAMMEAVTRYLPGVLGRSDCVEDDSILSGLLESPQYCAPRSIDQMAVPEVLLSGHHQEIDRWKLKQSLRRTLYSRPDLMNAFSFSKTLVKIIDQIILEDTK